MRSGPQWLQDRRSPWGVLSPHPPPRAFLALAPRSWCPSPGEGIPVSPLLLTQKSVTYPPGLFCYRSSRLFRAASQREPQGQLWLGRLYLEGWGVDKSVAEAAKWYKLAVDQSRRDGHPINAASHDQSASSLLLRALLFPPGDLALSHLSVTHDLQLAQRALSGPSVTLSMRAPGDPKPVSVVIDKGNAVTYVALFESRMNIYSHAIRQRGFQRLAQQYDIAASDGCQKLGVSPGPAVIDQDDFSLYLATGRFQGASRHRGTIVESVLVIEHAAQVGIYFGGDIQQGRIGLKAAQVGPAPAQLDCVLTLTAR